MAKVESAISFHSEFCEISHCKEIKRFVPVSQNGHERIDSRGRPGKDIQDNLATVMIAVN